MNNLNLFGKPDPLVWGRGSPVLEVFLEPTCPFSAKAFKKIDPLLLQAKEESLTVKIWLLSQPWHLFSSIVTRSIFAASTIETGAAGRDNAKAVMMAVFSHREEFEFTDHCKGPNLNKTPAEVIELISCYSGIDVGKAFQESSLHSEMKLHAKYARQNGIHLTPTFMVDGIISTEMSSGQEVAEWIEILSLP
ncbi:thioredoxin domain-containing protein [Motiliproteus sp. MSK22-1]|uniref:DsbA family protein n=1 Tax=Motiliproteus sp. MSK22-1 TaxID=1897630 RepID=UPI000977230B|nr:thioredoxin domain-containing protein [Motiliproteus sp. MSK22-1]OMH36225.1 thioredoxin [Motiliproteus sp. MSK22-1]